MSTMDNYIDDGSVIWYGGIHVGGGYYYYNDGALWPLEAHPEFTEDWYK